MDSRINIGDKLDLEKIEKRISADPDKKTEQYSSQVLDEGKNDSLFVAMPIHEGKLIPLSVGQEFTATFYTNSGLLQCKVVVSGRYKKGTLYLMEIEMLSELKKIQRREFFRFPCRIPLEYRIVEEGEKKRLEQSDTYNTDDESMNWKKGIMLDLSGGGIRFVSGSFEVTGSLVQTRFDILYGEETDTIYTFAQLLRSEKNPNNSSLYDNRLEFCKMDQGTREKIIRYIFEEQRRKRSQQLGLDS